MQKQFKKYFMCICLVIFFFTFISCSEYEKKNTGSLVLNLSEILGSRNLDPDINMNVVYYDINGPGPGSAAFSLSNVVSNVVTVNDLAPGSWSVIVYGKNAGGTNILSGDAVLTVTEEQTTSVTIDVFPIDGTGSLSLSVTWLVQVDNPVMEATLISTNGATQPLVFSISGNTASYANSSITTGYYTLIMQLKDGGDGVWYRVETVRILAGQTTIGDYLLQQGTGGSIITIEQHLQDPLIINLSGHQEILSENQNMFVTATVQNETNVNFVWYLNAQPIAGATNSMYYVVSNTLTPGQYRLDVVGMKDNRLGCTGFDFTVTGSSNSSSSTSSSSSSSSDIIKSYQKISDTEGGFTGNLDIYDHFGASIAPIGDLNSDGVMDIAVVLSRGTNNYPALWILFLNTDGTVLTHQKISETNGGFNNATFQNPSVACIGDLDGNGINDIAVETDGDNDGGTYKGAVWILFLNADGTVKFQQKISDTHGNFTGILDSMDYFGSSVTSIGDLNGDGINDIAVGANGDDDGGSDKGAVWILFLNADGTVKSHQKISDTQGGFTGLLNFNDVFGSSITSIGDLDGDGINDIAVGTYGDDGGGSDRGAVWILFLNADGTVKSHQKISDTQGNFTGTLNDYDTFGISVTSINDFNGDGITDIVVGAYGDDDGGSNRGAVWILLLNTDGTVKSHQKISATHGGFTGILDNSDCFGVSVASIGDLDSDGITDIAVGAYSDDDGGFDKGAVWILFLK